MAEEDSKTATNNVIGKSFTTVQQFHCKSALTFLSTTAKHENFRNKLGELAKKTGAANSSVPRMSKHDRSIATEKHNDLSEIDDILKDMPNNVEDGKTLLNQPSAICTKAPCHLHISRSFFSAVHL
jgi:hypothetical protein